MSVKLIFVKGGPGSGHHGHSGLSGVHGGSRPRGSGGGRLEEIIASGDPESEQVKAAKRALAKRKARLEAAYDEEAELKRETHSSIKYGEMTIGEWLEKRKVQRTEDGRYVFYYATLGDETEVPKEAAIYDSPERAAYKFVHEGNIPEEHIEIIRMELKPSEVKGHPAMIEAIALKAQKIERTRRVVPADTYVTLFHATHDEFVESIQKQGLIQGKEWIGRPPSVYFVESLEDAQKLGMRFLAHQEEAWNRRNWTEESRPYKERDIAIVKFRIPKSVYMRRKPDEIANRDFNVTSSGRITGNVPPGDILGAEVLLFTAEIVNGKYVYTPISSEVIDVEEKEDYVTIYQVAILVPPEKEREKGGPKSGHHGHAGLPGVHGGSRPSGASGGGSKRVWTGEQQAKPEKRLSKLSTGSAGERVAMKALEEKLGAPFSTLNKGVNNAPIDVAGNHHAVEVKTGLASNGKTAQHWRATIGQPGKKETELLKQMSSKEKREYNTWKRTKILERKHDALSQMAEVAGAEIKPATVGVIMSPDGSTADVFFIPGFHQRLPWNKYATDKYYVGTYDV